LIVADLTRVRRAGAPTGARCAVAIARAPPSGHRRGRRVCPHQFDLLAAQERILDEERHRERVLQLTTLPD